MADERDFRIRMDLVLPKEAEQYADQIQTALTPFLNNAVIINEGLPNEESGYIEVERCGHRLNQSCEKIARWEVGKGKVL